MPCGGSKGSGGPAGNLAGVLLWRLLVVNLLGGLSRSGPNEPQEQADSSIGVNFAGGWEVVNSGIGIDGRTPVPALTETGERRNQWGGLERSAAPTLPIWAH